MPLDAHGKLDRHKGSQPYCCTNVAFEGLEEQMLRKVHFKGSKRLEYVSATPYHLETPVEYFAVCGNFVFRFDICVKRVAKAQDSIIYFIFSKVFPSGRGGD